MSNQRRDKQAAFRASQGLQIPRREDWITVADEYGPFQFKMWVNHPPRLREAYIKATTEEESQRLLSQIVLEHNNWLDFDGQPYAQPWETRTEPIMRPVLDDEGNATFDDAGRPNTEPAIGDDGEPLVRTIYPFWDEIPSDLALTVIRHVRNVSVSLPNSVNLSRRN